MSTDVTLTAPVVPERAMVRRSGVLVAERYEVSAEHGRGGIGRVVRARDHQIGRDVAIKELLQHGHGAEARFLREARITGRLEHPSIVPVHEIGQSPDGTPFYAMKLIEGRTLASLLDDAGTLTERLKLLPNLIAVADAVAYAHSRQVIHRDLKPSNVIVGEYGETVVIDWGLAKDLTDGADADEPCGAPYRDAAADELTVAGQVLGTPAYMSPEQARGEPVDTRADVYALGAMLYHLLTGAPPHTGATLADRLDSARAASPKPIVRRWLGLRRDRIYRRAHDPLIEIAERAMSPDLAARHSTAKELATDLRAWNSRRTPSRALRWLNVAGAFLMGVMYHDHITALPLMPFLAFAAWVGAYVYVASATTRSLRPPSRDALPPRR